jgi:hypothetical protein
VFNGLTAPSSNPLLRFPVSPAAFVASGDVSDGKADIVVAQT